MPKILLLGDASPEDIENLEQAADELRKNDSSSHIVVIATPAKKEMTARSEKFNETILYPKKYGGISRLFNIKNLWGFLSQIRRENFDLSLVVYGSFHSRRYFKHELVSLLSRANKHGFITRHGEKNILSSRWAHLVHLWRRLALGYLFVKYLIEGTALAFHVFFALKDRLFPPTDVSERR